MVTSLPTSYPCFVRAIYSWSGEEKRDLGFVEGDVIEVLNTGDGNWWMGKLKRNKMVGSFPCNFVEFMDKTGDQSKEQPQSADSIRRQSVSPQPQPIEQSQPQPQYAQPQARHLPRSEILSDITNALNETFRPDQFQYDSDTESDEDIQRETEGPPPVPPPHSVLYQKGQVQGGQGGQNLNRTPNLDRTPSPLRNAMDDVMASLEGMDVSRSNSTSFTAVEDDSDMMRKSPIRARNSNTTITGMDDSKFSDAYGYEEEQRHHSQYAIDSFMNQNNSQSQQPRGDYNEDEDEDDENYLPFDPNSYDHMSRHGTYQSISSMHSLSVYSDSTTPTSMSNLSATSAGSLARRKQHNHSHSQSQSQSFNHSYQHHQDYRSPTPGGISEPHTVTEVPVNLPNSKNSGFRINGDSKSNTGSKSLKLKRSAGFLKNLFRSDSTDEKLTNGDNINGVQVQRARSVKSAKSGKSRYSISSSSIKGGLKKMGRVTGISSTDLRPTKSSLDMGGNSWIETRRDVHRANTITDHERNQRRKKREMEGVSSVQPLKALEDVQGNETLDSFTRGEGRLDPRRQDFSHVDAAIFAMHTWPQLMTPAVFASSRIGRQFQYDIDRLRAVFDFCASKISLEVSEDSYNNNYHQEESEDITSFSRLMQYKRATCLELAECIKSMCDSLEIHCEVVRGHLKAPGEITDKASVPRPNHVWNAVVINDEWRFVDAALASPSFPTRDHYYNVDKTSTINHFYFLTAPNELIYTHVPWDEADQHLVPPLNSSDALALPLAGPAAFEHNLKLLDYHLGDTRLHNFEMAQLDLAIPHGVDIQAEIVCGEDEQYPGLAQVYWENNRRFARVKAMLPEPYSQGVLQIYVAERNIQAKDRTNMPIAYSVGVTHSGQNAPFEFVARHPTPHCKRQDIYVSQPLCKKLCGGTSYVFSVRQHPSKGVTSGSGFSRTKLGIQSPSGKIHKLHRKGGSEEGLVYGTWEVNVKTMEVGTWRGLVLADRGNAWSVFAEWYCI